ncbi:MAG: hypothetical protein KDC53_15140 [Saprospiraceae bacterium]|nr:hypothetical protein [Saprospiraceae bacterium]
MEKKHINSERLYFLSSFSIQWIDANGIICSLSTTILLIFIQFFILNAIYPQNLVKNPGFEEYLLDPDYSPAGVNDAPGWFALGKTTDFFHAQYRSPFNIPFNFRGHKQPATGEGYAGIISFAFGSPSSNEFLVNILKEPLIRDQIYDLSFELSLSNLSRYGVDGIGAVVLHEAPTQKKVELGQYEYTIRNDYGHALSDTTKWVKIERQFRAEGGEQYLMIGSLYHETPITFSEDLDPNAPWAYYYIDNVYLAPCPKPVITQFELDTALCKGETITLHGLDDAKNYRWHQAGGVRQNRNINEDGLYILDNHYDCKVIQQYFRIAFDDCNCTIKLPTLYSHSTFFHMEVSPIVLSWDLRMYDGTGQFFLRTDEEKGLDPLMIPDVSATYFWIAELTCLGPEDNIFSNKISGKIIIQN